MRMHVTKFLCANVSNSHLTGHLGNWMDADHGGDDRSNVVLLHQDVCNPFVDGLMRFPSAHVMATMKVAASIFALWLRCENAKSTAVALHSLMADFYQPGHFSSA